MDTQGSMAHRLLGAAPGQDVSFEAFRRGQAGLSEMSVLMALEYVKTRKAAEKIYRAELVGRRRTNVVGRAKRRLDDFDTLTIPRGDFTGTAERRQE